eukprot:gnl/MRDRNA2_/MRDRNA2_101879_c0_seq1.p1 gnl/MRDRNA2_/MRDRNA2_101879_c0~~gnl/MRDRNA2_/MRDRNA2_101879_c0_seq1.p1  ORF type:complete len:223 (+),score=29.55 gnl/MRDRNA2_/MRDRNA2_101879_c0_seq1:64-732(+)
MVDGPRVATCKHPGNIIPIWGLYLIALNRNPRTVKAVTSSIVHGACQLFNQIYNNGKITNLRLLAAWFVWGTPSAVLAHHFNNVMALRGPKSILLKVILDHLIYRMPIYVAFTFFIRFVGETYNFRDAVEETTKVQPAMQKLGLKVWPMLQAANYSLVPLPLRVLYMNMCQAGVALYLTFLFKNNAADDKAEEYSNGGFDQNSDVRSEDLKLLVHDDAHKDT